MPPSNNFYQMSFATGLFGEEGIKVLRRFAPPAIRPALEAQLPNLVRIHDTGNMPWVGAPIGAYRWSLGVWSRPKFRICLYVNRTDHRPLTVREALGIEQEALARASKQWHSDVTIRPADFHVDSEIQNRIARNIDAGRHWSHGLAS